MSIASDLISLTKVNADSANTAFQLSAGDIISLTPTGTDSNLTYVSDNEGTIEKITVDETVAAIKILAGDLFDVTLQSDASTLTINADKVGSVFAFNSGANIKYNESGSAMNHIKVTETPAAIATLINNAQGGSGSLKTATATADGLTTGLLTGGSQYVQVTSASANNIIALPVTT